ncbi:MAG: SH3 domain-containing protein [Lachnospiraceae bacterium]|nr:SH3 domain-containing protein [Lachnospiraceae bacterium]
MKRRRRNYTMQIGVVVIALCILLAGIVLVKKYSPSKEKADVKAYFNITEKKDMAIVLRSEQLETMAVYEKGKVYVDYKTLHDHMDSRYYWDSNESKLLYTTPDDTYMAEVGSEDYYIGRKLIKGNGGEILLQQGDQIYVNLDYVKLNSALSYKVYKNPNRVVIETGNRKVEKATAKKDTQVRYRGGVKSPILTEIKKGDTLLVKEEGDSWTKVVTKDGYTGYVKKSKITKPEEGKVKVKSKNVEYNHVFFDGGTVNLAWHQTTNAVANQTLSSMLENTKKVNVVTPTWFYLSDSQGSIASIASSDYVTSCHNQGIQVWGLVSNLEQKVDTTKVLTTTTYRENLVSALIAKAIEYKLDGINVDIESLKSEVGDGFIQFIRELSLKCHDNDLILSVNNYVPSAYTAFYNRKEQANYADYVICMAYDEHYAGSKEGSVSSIDFVKNGVADSLKEVPKNQLILALPFYTREWALTPAEKDGEEYKVTSRAIGMKEAENLAKVNGATPTWDDKTGQYFVSYEKDGKTYKIWMEEEKSLDLKLQQVSENKLAGMAFWKLGFEKPAVWNTIVKYTN